MKKIDLLIWILSVALVFSTVSNILIIVNYPRHSVEYNPNTLKIGLYYGLDTLDPVDCWDRNSEDVINQVVETLFSNDLRDPKLPRINLLAESYYWKNNTVLHIKLREGVSFHDGTAFNASAAKWNIDRLQYLVNATGNNTGQVAYTKPLWMRPDGITPIINRTSISGQYNITLTLNGPYSPILNTFTHISSGMISPSAHIDDAMSLIDLTTENLVGTGPFLFDQYIPDQEVRMERWNEYWRPVAYFKEIIFEIFEYDTEIANALVGDQIDCTNMYHYMGYPISYNIIMESFDIPSLTYYYLGINNNKYNRTWRKAISYAINQTFIINDIEEGVVFGSTGAISPGFGDVYNSTVISVAPPEEGNLIIARQIMVSMGFGDMSWNNSQWIDIAENGSPFLTMRYTYYISSSLKSSLIFYVKQWLNLIGIAVEEDGVNWSEFLGYLFDDHNHLGMYFMGWTPDYLDPFNILDPLFNPKSYYNSAQVNDTHLNDLISLAVETIDEEVLINIYKAIQGYMAEVGYFHIPVSHPKLFFTHSITLRNYPYNALQKFQAHGIWRI